METVKSKMRLDARKGPPRLRERFACARIRSSMPGIAAVVVALLGLASATPTPAEPAERQRVSRATGGLPLDDFVLIDQHGRRFTQDDLVGQWTFILLGDARCGEPCTAALAALSGMRQRIVGTRRVNTTQVVFVSVAQESAEELRRYLAPYDEHFIGASGSAQTVARLAEGLGMTDAVPVSSGASASPQYPGVLSLIDADGIVWGQFLPPFDAQMLTARYLKTRIGR